VTLWHGDCRAVLRNISDCSADAVVTDPPYELAFMGRKWDATGIAFDPAVWSEVLRVLKPGGHLLASGGTRTFHRMAVAIEDAGFEIRDSIAWLYGQGFPKNRGQLKPAFEPIVVARKPIAGTVAANVLQHGTGALNIDACRIETSIADAEAMERANTPGSGRFKVGATGSGTTDFGRSKPGQALDTTAGRWPANVVLDESQAIELDKQGGVLTSGVMKAGSKRRARGNAVIFGDDKRTVVSADTYADTGGASRYFYTAKASTSERPNVDGVGHPTVKPLDLMRWLVRLVTPPQGVVLDLFAGSGTTGEACVIEDFQCILIEQADEYLPLIVQRLTKPIQTALI